MVSDGVRSDGGGYVTMPRSSLRGTPLIVGGCVLCCDVVRVVSCRLPPRPGARKLMPLSVSSSGLGSPLGLVPPPAPTPTPAGFFFSETTGQARKGLPADPDMRELFTTVFLDFEKEIQTFHFLETVRVADRGVGCNWTDPRGRRSSSTFTARLLLSLSLSLSATATKPIRVLCGAIVFADSAFCCPRMQAGSTCTVATVFGDALIVANIGDSDAILCRKGVPHMLSYQHKASDEAEKQRIIAGGGTVFHNFGSWRVAGMLEVSQSQQYSPSMGRSQTAVAVVWLAVVRLCGWWLVV